jgi:hypothetical protein
MDTLKFAKILNDSGDAMGLNRDVYHREIEKRANETRGAQESPEQAYARIIETPEGRDLFRAYKRAPVAAAPVQAAQDLKPEPAGPASKELNGLASELARVKRQSFEQAYTSILTDPDRKDLVRRVRAEEMAATRAVHDQRAPIWAAERAYSR